MISLRNYTLLLSLLTFLCIGISAAQPKSEILITSIKNMAEEDNAVSISCNLFNLSRNSIVLNNDLDPETVNFKFEESFSRSKLNCYKNKIIDKLLSSDLELKRGKMLKAVPIKLPMMEAYAQDDNTKKREKKVTHSMFTSVRKKRRKRKKEHSEEISFSVNKSIEASKNSHHLKDVCVDIQIDTIIVVKRTRNYVTIEYTLSNQGKADANLYGEPYDESDNLALKFFLGRSSNITRGSLPLGGVFIEKGVKHGILKVGETYKSTMKLSTKDLTKFTPYLIMKVDPFNVMNECHRRNNDKAIKLSVK